MAEQSAIIEVFIALAAGAGGVLSVKPTVLQVSVIIGVSVTAAEIDAAWIEYQASLGEPETEPEPEQPRELVTNHYTNPIWMWGVDIPQGETRRVPGFQHGNYCASRWKAAGVITVE